MDLGFLTIPVLSFLGLFGFAVVTEDTEVLITEFTVAESLVGAGYTPDVVTNRIGGSFQLIGHKARTAKSERPFGQENQRTFINSLVKRYNTRELVNTARESLGLIEIAIGGSLIVSPDNSWLIRINVRRPDRPTETRFLTGPADQPEDLFFRAGMEIVQAVDPYVVASYHYETALDKGSTDFSLTQEAILKAYPRLERKNHHWLHNLWGLTLLRSGDPLGSIKEFQKALALQPDFPLSIHNWGLALIALGEYPQAIQKFRKALAVDANGHRTVHSLSQWAYAESLMNNEKRAETLFSKAFALSPTNAALFHTWGRAFEHRNKLSQAAAKYQLASLYDPVRSTYKQDFLRVAGDNEMNMMPAIQ